MPLIRSSLPPIAAGRLSTHTLFHLLRSGRRNLKMGDFQAQLFNHVLQRSYATTDAWPKKFAATVIGGGPAGMAVVGNLLEQQKGPVLWLDEGLFGGGRLHRRYRSVPSNTKVKFFTMFADALKPFQQITKDAAVPNAYRTLQDLDPEETCHISHAADLSIMLAGSLHAGLGVRKYRSKAKKISWSDANQWEVEFNERALENPSIPGVTISASSDLLFLCTGSHPQRQDLRNIAEKRTIIHLDKCLRPSDLKRNLLDGFKKMPESIKNPTIAVIGASHSAILVLRNLHRLASNPDHGLQELRIKWFTRHELRYAEERDGWIKRDNTGLKGEVATWAKENLEADTFLTSDVSKYIEKVKTSSETERKDMEEHLHGCQFEVQAVGFTRNPLPLIERNGAPLDIEYDHETSGFVDAQGEKVRGLYGAGIAFPEKVIDPEGDTEYAVGLWKFMKYLKRVAPTWTA